MISSCERLNLSTFNEWQQIASINIKRCTATAEAINNCIYLFGFLFLFIILILKLNIFLRASEACKNIISSEIFILFKYAKN